MAVNSGAFAFSLPNRGGVQQQAQLAANRQVAQDAQTPAPQDMDLIEPTKGLLQSGVDGEEAYYQEWQNMNNFASDMYAKYGIDVTRPDPNIPGATDAYRQFRGMVATTKQLGQQLRSGYETQQKINEAAMRGDLFMPQGMETGKITSTQRPTQFLPSGQEKQVESFNTMLKQTKLVTDQDLAQAKNIRQGVVDYLQQDYYQALVNNGYSPDYAQQYVQYQIEQLQEPMMDEATRQSLQLRRQSAARRGGSGTSNEKLMRRQTIIQDIIEKGKAGEKSQYLGMLQGGKIGGAPIIEATQMRPSAAGKQVFGMDVLAPELQNPLPAIGFKVKTGTAGGQTQEDVRSIDLNDPRAWTQINNILNDAPGQENVRTEDLMDYFGGEQQQTTQQTQQQTNTLSLSDLKNTYDFGEMTDDEIMQFYEEKGYTITE